MTGADGFQQLIFDDPQTGVQLLYNLFIPADYDPDQSYPLVLFIHDGGEVSDDPRQTLRQCLGATIWATPEEQAKHPSFVVAPQYAHAIVNDLSESMPDVDATANLMRFLQRNYSIDPKRIYTTGQSMGCMASIDMLICHPGLFAAALLVAGQWDAAKMSALSGEKMWVIVSEGDRKAFPGMNACMAALEACGAKVSRATWNGRASREEFGACASTMIAEARSIMYSVLARGTVVPEGLPDDGRNNHINTWPVAYAIEGVRDWLFSQTMT